MNKKRIFWTLGVNAIVESINKLSPLFILYLAKSRLGIERFGFAQFAMTLIESAIPFIVYGYTIVVSQEMAKALNRPKELGELTSSFVALKLIHAFLSMMGLLSLCYFIPEYNQYTSMVLLLSFVLFTSAIELFPLLMATQKTYLHNSILGGAKILSLILIALLVTDSTDAGTYATITLGTNAIVSVVVFFFAIRFVTLSRPRWHSMKHLFTRGSHFALIYLGLMFLERFDMYFAEHFGGTTAAGLYAGPAKIGQSLQSIVMVASVVFVSELMAVHDKESFGNHVRLALRGALFALIPVSAGIWFIDRSLVTLIFGGEYAPVAQVLSILVCATCIQGVLTVLASQVLMLKSRPSLLTSILFVATLVGCLVSYMLSPSWELTGIAVGALVAKLVATIAVIVVARNILQLQIWRASWKFLLAAAVMCVCLVITDTDNLWLNCGVMAATYFPLVAVLSPNELKRIAAAIQRKLVNSNT